MKRALIALAIANVACGPKAHRPAGEMPWASSGIDWTKPPPVVSGAPFVPPHIYETPLDNGIRIIIVENHRLPIVAITAIHHAAGGREDGGRYGLAALTADLLDDRPGNEETAHLAEALDQLGSRIQVDVATDHVSVQLVTLSNHVAEALGQFKLVNADGRFTDNDVASVRRRRITDLLERRTRARTIAGQIFDRVAFGDHPYAFAAEGTPESVATITAADVRKFYDRAYRPDALTIVVVGDITRDAAERLIDNTFGSWPNQRLSNEAAPPPLASLPKQLAYVDLPGAEQTVAIIGARTSAAGGPHQIAADVGNAIVGGGVGARLDRKLHDELGVTFGAGSSFWRGQWGGTWAVASTFRTEKTGEALRAAIGLIRDARTTAPTPVEVAAAKASLARAAAQHFETTTGTARALERVLVQGFPASRYASYLQGLAAVTPEAVHAAIETDWADLSIVVVGDWSKIESDMRALGLPVVQYRNDGTRVQ